MPKSKTLSAEAKLKKKRIQQQERRIKQQEQQQQQQDQQQQVYFGFLFILCRDEEIIDTSTKVQNVNSKTNQQSTLGKRPTKTFQDEEKNITAKRQRFQEQQQQIIKEVIDEVDDGEILQGLPKQQRKSLIDYMGRKFNELQQSQEKFQSSIMKMQDTMMEKMQNIEMQFSSFLNTSAELLGNNDYKIKSNIQLVLDTWKYTKEAPKLKLSQQLQSLEKFELDQLDTHCNHPKLNHWYSELKFIQFALYMVILEQQGAAKNTIKNNANSFRKISQLLLQKDINVLTRRDHYKIRDFLLEEYKDINVLSTIRGYLQDYCTAIKTITGRPLKIKIAYKEFAENKPMVELKDIYQIIEYYKNQDDERLKLLSFFLYLLVLTGARNETIRTVRFDQFIIKNQGTLEEEYILQLYASKTGKSFEVKVDEGIFKFVQDIKNKRQEAMDKIMAERRNNLQQHDIQLINRRRQHVFTFYSQASLHLHIKKMKLQFQNVKNINSFIVHNIRTLRLIDIFETQGLQAAQQFAGHSSNLTTLNNYLNKKNLGNDFKLYWGASAENLNIDDMKHFDSVVKKSDLIEESDSEDENLDKNDLLDASVQKKNKRKQDKEEVKNQIEQDDEDKLSDEDVIIGIV